MVGPLAVSTLVGLRVPSPLPVADAGAVGLVLVGLRVPPALLVAGTVGIMSLPSTEISETMGAEVEGFGAGIFVGDCGAR